MLLTELDQRIWDPLDAISEIRNEMNRLFRERTGGSYPYPAINLWTGEKEALVTAELPGVDPEDLNISCDGNTLTLQGERKWNEAREYNTMHLSERPGGAFSRSLKLPFHVDVNGIQAQYSKGVLNITLPRTRENLPKKIKVV